MKQRVAVLLGIVAVALATSARAQDGIEMETIRTDPRVVCDTRIFPTLSPNGRTWSDNSADLTVHTDMATGTNNATGSMPDGFGFVVNNSRSGSGDWTTSFTVTPEGSAQLFDNNNASGTCARGSNLDRPANQPLRYQVVADGNANKTVRWCFIVDYEIEFEERDERGRVRRYRDRTKSGVEISCTQHANPNRRREREMERESRATTPGSGGGGNAGGGGG